LSVPWRRGDGAHHKSGIGEGGEVDEEDTVAKGVKRFGPGRERDTGLAHAAGAGEGHDSGVGGEQRDELGDALGATDEG